MPVEPFSVAGLILAVAALIIGVAKTSVGGFAALAVAAFAAYLPTRESTAAVLLLLIVGDVVAVARYRRSASWPLLRRLLPSVLPGVALGALFLRVVDDRTLRVSIGLLLTLIVAIQLVMRLRARGAGGPGSAGPYGSGSAAPGDPASAGPDGSGNPQHPHPALSLTAGTAAGFTTMTANAAGPVMTLYLLACRVDKMAFVGTNAWFFLLVNLSKTPFSAALGLFPASTLALTVALAPFVLVGTWLGVRLVRFVSQATFDALALLASAVAAVALLVR